MAAGAAAPPALAAESWERTCRIHIVAVSGQGEGVLGNLTVTVRYPGSGRVYISTSPASMVDTQGSARIAAFAASLVAGVAMDDYDFYYAIDSPSIIIGGPSAGAAMALATLILLTGAECPEGVAITGMIQPDASIGPVGGLKEKLEAAASGGDRLFIVPAGQEVYTYYVTRYHRAGPFVWVEREPVTINLTEYGSQLGVRVETAATLLDAYRIAVGGLDLPRGENLMVPAWVQGLLASYVEDARDTVASLLEGVEPQSAYIRALAGNATALAEAALSELRGGDVYRAAIDATRAKALAAEARALYEAVEERGDLDVTGLVEEANDTIEEAWSAASQAPLSPLAVESAVKAYAKLGVAAYYLQNALDNLVEDDGGYKLPAGFFGVDPTGAHYAALAWALADWAMFWAEAAGQAPEAEPVPGDRLEAAASMLVAQAKTTAAYVVTLLEEAGVGAEQAGLAVYLADQAVSAGDPVAAIGYAIESIAESTRAIHESFTLDPARTAQGLRLIAEAELARGTPSIQARLLLTLTGDVEEELIAYSRAVLYAWALAYLTSQPPPGPEPQETTTTTPAPSEAATQEAGAATTTPAAEPEPQETHTPPAAEPATALAMVLAGLLGIAVGVIVGYAARREGPS